MPLIRPRPGPNIVNELANAEVLMKGKHFIERMGQIAFSAGGNFVLFAMTHQRPLVRFDTSKILLTFAGDIDS